MKTKHYHVRKPFASIIVLGFLGLLSVLLPSHTVHAATTNIAAMSLPSSPCLNPQTLGQSQPDKFSDGKTLTLILYACYGDQGVQAFGRAILTAPTGKLVDDGTGEVALVDYGPGAATLTGTPYTKFSYSNNSSGATPTYPLPPQDTSLLSVNIGDHIDVQGSLTLTFMLLPRSFLNPDLTAGAVVPPVTPVPSGGGGHGHLVM